MSSVVAHRSARTYTSLKAAWIPLFALCLAFFVEMVDNTLLTIALPTIGRDLGIGTTALQWVTGAYSLTFGSLLLTAGSTADRLGRRRVLLVGLAVFGLLSLLVVGVNSSGQLIASRAALGVAAAYFPDMAALAYLQITFGDVVIDRGAKQTEGSGGN